MLMTPRSENSLSMGVLLHPAVGYTSVERVSGPPLWELCGLGFVLYLKMLKNAFRYRFPRQTRSRAIDDAKATRRPGAASEFAPYIAVPGTQSFRVYVFPGVSAAVAAPTDLLDNERWSLVHPRVFQ